MPCIWLGHIGEYRLRPSRLGANTTFPRRPAASGDQDGIGPHLSGLRRYSPICPRQTHSITPLRCMCIVCRYTLVAKMGYKISLKSKKSRGVATYLEETPWAKLLPPRDRPTYTTACCIELRCVCVTYVALQLRSELRSYTQFIRVHKNEIFTLDFLIDQVNLYTAN